MEANTLTENNENGLVLQDVGTISWSEAADKYKIPALYRYPLSPEMLEATVKREFEDKKLKIQGTVELNRNFAIAKVAESLDQLSMYDRASIEEFLGEVADYRVTVAQEAKQTTLERLLKELRAIDPKAALAAEKELAD